MKTFVVVFAIVCATATAGTILYLRCHKTSPASNPAAESSPAQTEQSPPEIPNQEQPKAVSQNANEPAPEPVANSTSDAVQPTAPSTPHSQAVDTLVSTQTSYNDRWALLKQLKNTGQLDTAIAELNQRAIDNPTDVETQVALGEALMSKFPIQDYKESAMLGLQINQSFDTALKLDPANWEAQYSKANALSGWPPQMNTGPEVVQQLSSLIDQQDAMASQPQFANSYALLGDEYQKLGQPQKAQATWQIGLAKFPGDSTLQNRVANQ